MTTKFTKNAKSTKPFGYNIFVSIVVFVSFVDGALR